VILYQEQVMQIANRLPGFSLGEADICGAPWAKRTTPKWRPKRKNSWRDARREKSRQRSRKDFDLMAEFAGYGFNKSHSCAYALLAYQTAYLKTHYPVESWPRC